MITSTSSSQVKHICQLQKKSKAREEAKEFVVEGIRMVSEVPFERLVKMYISEGYMNSNEHIYNELLQKYEGKIEVVSDNVFSHMSDTKTPQGIMAIVKMIETKLSDMLNGSTDMGISTNTAPLLIIVENLQDPGNLGTILRMGEGAGVTGVIISKNSVDIYNPKTIRSTMGSLYRVPFLRTEDLRMTIEECKEAGVKMYAAHLKGKETYLSPNYRNATGFLIGNEGNGLTDETANLADEFIRIPMAGQVESLNAAIACTVLTYEAFRQRIV